MDEFGKRPARRRVYDGVMKGLVLLGAGLTIALLVALIGYILVRGLPHVTWQLLSTSPSMMKGTIGILPNILNTLYLILFTLLISLPLGVGAAVYLTEYAKNRRFAEMVEFAEKTLENAGIYPYYMYRQSKTVGNLENVGYAKPGTECLYNVYTMDETHTILACGASAVTKMREPGGNNIERIFNFKYPYEYISRFSEIKKRKDGILKFYEKYPADNK